MIPRPAGKKFFKAFMKAQLLANELEQTLYLDFKLNSRRWYIHDKQLEQSMTVRPIPKEIMAKMDMR